MKKGYLFFFLFIFAIQCAFALSPEQLKHTSLEQRAKILFETAKSLKAAGQITPEEFDFIENLKLKRDMFNPNSFWIKPGATEFSDGFLEAYKARFPSKIEERRSFINSVLLKSCLKFTYQELGYQTSKVRTNVPIYNEPIPESVINFDVDAPNTINVKKYLKNRISLAIKRALLTSEFVDIYIGPESELKEFYRVSPVFDIRLGNPRKLQLETGMPSIQIPKSKLFKLDTPLSQGFYVYPLTDEMDKEKHSRTITVIGDVGGKSKLFDTLLRLRFLGVDLDKVRIWGTFEYLMRKDVEGFTRYIRSKEIKPKVLFLGPRWEIVKYFRDFAEKSPDYKMAAPDGEWFGDSDDKSLDNIFKLNYTLLLPEKPGVKPFAVLSSKMPNGDSVGVFVKLALENGIKYVVAAGAAGSLTELTQKGSLQIFKTAQLEDFKVEISDKNLVKIDNPFKILGKDSGYEFLIDGKNITVYSPLLETKEWLTNARAKYTVVDVESFYILKEFNDFVNKTKCGDCKILPALFISDIVGYEPLEEKISTQDAWKKVVPFLDEVFKTLKQEITQ